MAGTVSSRAELERLLSATGALRRPHDSWCQAFGQLIDQATRFQFAVNLKATRALGITIPQPVLLRADEVLE